MEGPTGRGMERAETEASGRRSSEGPRHSRHSGPGHTFRVTAVARLLATSALAGAAIGCGPGPESAAAGFDVMEKSIAELNLALEAGTVTSQELVEQYLARIEAYDLRGPALNAIVTLNPRAGEDAAALDAERASGAVRGPLHGIPVLLKDNYDTHDMPTTAGVVALAASIPPDDAFQVRRLREAGAVILGKTNMHELARGITTVGSLTGQTRNPYDPTRNPGGSSGGTGAGRRRQLRGDRNGKRHMRVDPDPLGTPRPRGAPGDAGSRERGRDHPPLPDPGHRRATCEIR